MTTLEIIEAIDQERASQGFSKQELSEAAYASKSSWCSIVKRANEGLEIRLSSLEPYLHILGLELTIRRSYDRTDNIYRPQP